MSAATAPLQSMDAADYRDASTLTEAQLRQVLDWDPDFSGLDPMPMLLAAARNKFPGGRIPVSLIEGLK